MAGWPTGFFTHLPAHALHLVVIRHLPQTPETLLLRLLGRGHTLASAIVELPQRQALLRAIIAERT